MQKIFVEEPPLSPAKSIYDVSFQTFRRVSGLSCDINSSTIEAIIALMSRTRAK